MSQSRIEGLPYLLKPNRKGAYPSTGLDSIPEHFQGWTRLMQARPGNGCERCGQGVATGCNRVADKKASDYPARFKQTANRTQTDSALCAW